MPFDAGQQPRPRHVGKTSWRTRFSLTYMLRYPRVTIGLVIIGFVAGIGAAFAVLRILTFLIEGIVV